MDTTEGRIGHGHGADSRGPASAPGATYRISRLSGRLGLAGGALCCALLLTSCGGVGRTDAPDAKPKSSPPPTKEGGAGLYSAGGRVYPAHRGDQDWAKSGAGSAEAYRKWQAFNKAEVKKTAKPTPPGQKRALPPVPAKKQHRPAIRKQLKP